MRTASCSLFSLLLVSALAAGCAADAGSFDSSNAELAGRPTFEVFEGASGGHYFHFEAANHEIILASEDYTSRAGALGGVLSVLDHGGFRANYEVLVADNGEHYFNLRARNGQVIGMSELYSSSAAAARGVAATIRAVAGYLEFQHARRGARFDVFEGEDGQFYFNLHAKNGEIVLRSQGYASEAAALAGVFSAAENGVDEARYGIHESADGGAYFNLTATNHRVIGTSEIYASRAGAERARDALIALLPQVELL